MLADGLTLVGDSDIGRELISRRGIEFPLETTNGQIFQLTQASGEYEPGIYTYSVSQLDWILQTDSERDPYDMSISIVGRPKADAVVAQAIAVRTSIIEAGFDKSRAVAQVPATSEAVFILSILDDQDTVVQSLGTVTFASGSKFGQFTATSQDEMLLQPGELLSVQAPVIRDATLQQISITIAGHLAVLND